MPNHIANRIEIIGTDEQIKSVREFLKGEPFEDGEERSIDFNKVIPMPEELNITSGSMGELGEGILFGTGGMMFLRKSEVERRFIDMDYQHRQEAIELGLKYKSNLEKHNARTWYDWHRENWGTKWNAYNISVESENVILFDTAWNNILCLVEKISLKFPEVEFSYKWSDEDSGNNCGEAEVINGESQAFVHISGSDGAWNLYFELHPGSEDDYEKVDGEWRYKEEE